MKPLYVFLPMVLFLQSARSQPDSSNELRLYPVKSCRILYRYYDGPTKGESAIIFDDWGREEKEVDSAKIDTAGMRKELEMVAEALQHSHLRIAGSDSLSERLNGPIATVLHTLRLRLARTEYHIDLNTKTGYRSSADPLLMFDTAHIEQSEIGVDTILGKPCRIMEVQHAYHIWYWGRIPLKKVSIRETEMPAGEEEYAVTIDENYKIKPDEFKIPVNVKMQPN